MERKYRPQLVELLGQLRKGDEFIVWKLDRLGRSIRDLIKTVTFIQEKGAGFQSLQDSINILTPAGKLTFHLFAALAEFERDIIRQRTKAGLDAARVRGIKGGRPKELFQKAKHTAMIAERLYKEGILSTAEICEQLFISKMTLNSSLKHQGVKAGIHRKKSNLINQNIQNLTSLRQEASLFSNSFIRSSLFNYAAIEDMNWPNRLWFNKDFDQETILLVKNKIFSNFPNLIIPYWDIYDSNSNQLLEQNGFIKLFEQIGMSLKLRDSFEVQTGLKIIIVSTKDEAITWCKLFKSAF